MGISKAPILYRVLHYKNKDGKEALGERCGAFLFENGTVRVIRNDESTFDIALKSEIIAMNSGGGGGGIFCYSLFIVDAKMRAYEIKDKTAVGVTGLPDGLKIKDISCGDEFTVFLSECGRVFGMGSEWEWQIGIATQN